MHSVLTLCVGARMQIFRILTATVLITTGSIGLASGQSLTDTGGPSEIPPASYTGKQYVDSRGCVYIRAGYDGSVTWVPRVTRSRELVCGFAPTLTAVASPSVHEVAETVAVVESPEVVAAPVTKTAVARTTKRPVSVAVAPAPLPSSFKIPRGFRVAWTDGRLNPKRGPRTAKGDAQMDMIWQHTIPRQLYPEVAAGGARVQYVQVGAYSLPSNVDTVVTWLQKKRLPVSLSGSRQDGRNVQLVLAGPFDSQNELDRVLAMTHRAGFSDAFLR